MHAHIHIRAPFFLYSLQPAYILLHLGRHLFAVINQQFVDLISEHFLIGAMKTAILILPRSVMNLDRRADFQLYTYSEIDRRSQNVTLHMPPRVWTQFN